MWLVADYVATNLFSLKVSSATSSGGKSHLVPTPFVVKMALIDAGFRLDGQGERDFSWIRSLNISLKVPTAIVVNNSFMKILKEAREGEAPYQQTVGLRQYVFWDGLLHIAFDITQLDKNHRKRLGKLITLVNYFGKRGSFVQYRGQLLTDELEPGYSFFLEEPNGEDQGLINQNMIIQLMDDMAGNKSFDTFNSYSNTRMKLFEDRVFKPVVLLSIREASSRDYTFYRSVSPSST